MKFSFDVFLFRIAALCVSLAATLGPDFSFALDSAAVSQTLATRLTTAKVTALQVAFKKDGLRLYTAEIGTADASGRTPVTKETRFYSASMTKMLTASALLQLNERGLLSLNDLVVDHLPWFANHPSPQARRVTLAQVLSHTSGMSRNGVEFWSDETRWSNGPVPSEAELEKAALEQTFGVIEGSRLKYSNLGYELLGQVIGGACDRCRGKTKTDRYVSYIEKNILNRLKMTKSGFNPSLKAQKLFATPYSRPDASGVRKPYGLIESSGASVAAWGLFSTAEDFALYMDELSLAALSKPNKLFASDVSDAITQPIAWDLFNPSLGHSLGFRLIKTNNGLLVGHTGTFPGFSSAGFISINDGSVGVVYLNSIDAGGLGYLMDVFASTTGEKLAPEAPKLPPEVLPTPIPGNPFEAIVGSYAVVYEKYDVVYESDRYFLVQGGVKLPLYIERSVDGRTIRGRVGTNAPYFAWVGDAIEFLLDPSGRVEKMRGANSILAYPR